MSRPRRGVRSRADAMPDWLATYRPELWTDDLDDPLQVHYFGRFRWTDSRTEWLLGGDPRPRSKSPRPVHEDSFYTSPIPETGVRGNPPKVNRAPSVPKARPIKLH